MNPNTHVEKTFDTQVGICRVEDKILRNSSIKYFSRAAPRNYMLLFRLAFEIMGSKSRFTIFSAFVEFLCAAAGSKPAPNTLSTIEIN
jgi:hypothetical protein